jgi:transcriptional regulator with XRE-family HTH domain
MNKGKSLPAKRSNVQIEPTSPLGIAIKNARVAKQITQRSIAEALAAKCGGHAANVRVSAIELSRQLPTDAELTVIAQVLGLSVVSLREKREASRGHREATQKRIYEGQLVKGTKVVSFRMKPRASKVPPPAPVSKVRAAKPAKLAAVPALADLVEQIDEIAPMPTDKDQRKRWFQCVSELSRMAAS